MNKSELSGREFERILEKSGFTRPDYIKFLAEKHKIKRTLSWSHWLITHHRNDKKVPLKWVVLLKEMVREQAIKMFGEKEFESWWTGKKQGLNDSAVDPVKAFRDAHYEEWQKLPKKPIAGMEEIWEMTTKHKTTRTVEDFLRERQEEENL